MISWLFKLKIMNKSSNSRNQKIFCFLRTSVLLFNHSLRPVLTSTPFLTFSICLFHHLAEWKSYRWPWKWEYVHLISWSNSLDWALIPELLFTLWNMVKMYFWGLRNSTEMIFFYVVILLFKSKRQNFCTTHDWENYSINYLLVC